MFTFRRVLPSSVPSGMANWTCTEKLRHGGGTSQTTPTHPTVHLHYHSRVHSATSRPSPKARFHVHPLAHVFLELISSFYFISSLLRRTPRECESYWMLTNSPELQLIEEMCDSYWMLTNSPELELIEEILSPVSTPLTSRRLLKNIFS